MTFQSAKGGSSWKILEFVRSNNRSLGKDDITDRNGHFSLGCFLYFNPEFRRVVCRKEGWAS